MTVANTTGTLIPTTIQLDNMGHICASGGGGGSGVYPVGGGAVYITNASGSGTLANAITGTYPHFITIDEHWNRQHWVTRAISSDNETVLDALEKLFAVMRLAHGEESLDWSK